MNATPMPADQGGGQPRVTRIELSLKSLLAVLGLLAGLWLLRYALPVVLVLVVALMIVGSLNPFVAWLERRKVRRPFAIFPVFATGAARERVGINFLSGVQLEGFEFSWGWEAQP